MIPVVKSDIYTLGKMFWISYKVKSVGLDLINNNDCRFADTSLNIHTSYYESKALFSKLNYFH